MNMTFSRPRSLLSCLMDSRNGRDSMSPAVLADFRDDDIRSRILLPACRRRDLISFVIWGITRTVLAQIISTAFFSDDFRIDFPCCDIEVFMKVDIDKPFIVS